MLHAPPCPGAGLPAPRSGGRFLDKPPSRRAATAYEDLEATLGSARHEEHLRRRSQVTRRPKRRAWAAARVVYQHLEEHERVTIRLSLPGPAPLGRPESRVLGSWRSRLAWQTATAIDSIPGHSPWSGPAGANDVPAQSDLTPMVRDDDSNASATTSSGAGMRSTNGQAQARPATPVHSSTAGDGKINKAVCARITNPNANVDQIGIVPQDATHPVFL